VDVGSIFVTMSLQRGVVIFFNGAIVTEDEVLVQADGGDLAIAMGDVKTFQSMMMSYDILKKAD
jgi:predicted GH43/DUF377 family glycosyl hydrolase